MTSVPLGEGDDRLATYVAQVLRTHESVTITKDGEPVAVLISQDELNGFYETLDILRNPETVEALRQAQEDADAGRYSTIEEIKAEFGTK